MQDSKLQITPPLPLVSINASQAPSTADAPAPALDSSQPTIRVTFTASNLTSVVSHLKPYHSLHASLTCILTSKRTPCTALDSNRPNSRITFTASNLTSVVRNFRRYPALVATSTGSS